ncbi:hypothetical protein [Streptomyces sp. NPDC008137]|uniref:hypothetical protein n=1 Tax=Streptomyces sp. NPDC008137 TaxID=3364813 RepID=UPI0036E0AE71
MRELEKSRYLRTVADAGRGWGRRHSGYDVYEVFDTPYECEPPAGEPEKVRTPAPDAPGSSSQRTLHAARLLGSLGITHPCLTLGASQVWRLAPLVVEWWDAGTSDAGVRAALTGELPSRVPSPAALVEHRLRHQHPLTRQQASA